MFRHRDQGVLGIRWNARTRNMGRRPLGAITLGDPPPHTFYNVHGPVAASADDLNSRVDLVQSNIEHAGNWKVWTYAVSAGETVGGMQVVRFTVYRPDEKGSKPAAIAVVQAALLKTNISLGPINDWLAEVNQQIVQPSVQQGKDAAKNPLTLPLPGWVKAVAVGGVALYVLNSLVRAKKAFL